MKKQIFAAILLLVLLLPMFAGIGRIKRIPRDRQGEKPDDDISDAD